MQCKSKANPKANHVCFGKIVIELKAVSAHETLTVLRSIVIFTLYTINYKLYTLKVHSLLTINYTL